MSNRRRKSIGQAKIRAALERRLVRGRLKAEAKRLQRLAKSVREEA